MEQIELQVSDRQTLGKKVSALRRQGITPVHVFGHGIESVALQADTAKLQRVLAAAGKTRLINLTLNNEKKPRTVVMREAQTEPLTGALLHVDFYQVKTTEKVKVEIPIVLVGESLILKSNMLVQALSVLTVECLPAKIPTHVELDISSLTEKDEAVRVKDIKLGADVTVLNDPGLMVARVITRPIEKVEEKVEAKVTPEEGAEAPEAAAPAEEKSEKSKK